MAEACVAGWMFGQNLYQTPPPHSNCVPILDVMNPVKSK